MPRLEALPKGNQKLSPMERFNKLWDILHPDFDASSPEAFETLNGLVIKTEAGLDEPAVIRTEYSGYMHGSFDPSVRYIECMAGKQAPVEMNDVLVFFGYGSEDNSVVHSLEFLEGVIRSNSVQTSQQQESPN